MKKLFLVLAALVSVAWVALRLAGFAQYVSVLSGTLPEGGVSSVDAAWRCALYVAVHFLFVLGVPTLVLGAGLVELYDRARARRIPGA